MSKEKRRIPKLRFPGFTEDWEQRKLSEVTTCFDNLRVPVTASDRVPGKIPYYGANGIQDYVSGYTHSGEFVLIAEDGANDLNDYPIQYVNGAIWVNNHAHVIAGYKEKLENKFLSYSLKTVKMSTFIVGGGRSKLNLKALLEISISMPNYDEQCCIGKFIETIDKTITLHQRKLDNLKLKKKALLQKLFPKNGERYPELRFPGFTDAWEQRKLGDVADVRDGTHDSPKFYNDGFPLVTSKNLKDGSIDFSDCSFISEQDFDEINKRSKVDPGDILFGMIGTIGKPAIVEYTGFAIKNVALIKEGNIINNRFIYHLLSSKVFDNYIARENAGGTQKFIALNQIRNFIFSAPTLAEQNKIIELLDYISQFITLHQRKLDHLQLQKKALLQQMFV